MGLSGTTLTSVLLYGSSLFTANVGDSRSILVSEGGRVRQLTNDHTADIESEKIRVLQKGGVIKQLVDQNRNPIGPKRIWLPDSKTPGLAMTRSLGDAIAHSIGGSCEAELKVTQLTSKDYFVILASDGVWEFMSNEEVARIAIPFYA